MWATTGSECREQQRADDGRASEWAWSKLHESGLMSASSKALLSPRTPNRNLFLWWMLPYLAAMLVKTGESQLLLQRAALEYMDQTGVLNTIKQQCHDLANTNDRAYHFIIAVEPADLTELSVPLGNILLENPSTATEIFQEVVYTMVRSLDLLPPCESQTQVVVMLRILSLPSLPSYQINSSQDLTTFSKNQGLLKYAGVVCGLSTVHKYTKSARFACQEETCVGSVGNHYIRIHVAGAREAQIIRKDFACAICKSPLKEDISCRVLSDKIILELIDEEAFRTPGDGGKRRHQAITAYVRDDLVTGIEIGQKYTIIGVAVHDVSKSDLAIEVNNLINHDSFQLGLCRVSTLCQQLPDIIQYLYNDRKNSPWGFTLSMAYAFGAGVVAAGTYLHLKLGLLLSLVGSTSSKDCRGLDLLAVGCDTVMLHRLLRYAATFSSRLVSHSSVMPLTATVGKDRHGSGTAFIDGGSLLLARGGVCLLSDLSTGKKSFRQTLQQVLELGSLRVDIPPKLGMSLQGQQLQFPIHSHVWAFTDPLAQHRPQHFEDLTQQVDMGNISRSLADVFGMVYFAEARAGSHAEHMLVHQIMLAAMGTETVELVKEEEFKQYLKMAWHQEVTFSLAAERLVRGYFVASRRVRASATTPVTFPPSAVATLTSLARAHAKLRLQPVVQEEDAVIAILLYEESATYRYGYSVLNVQPLPHVKDNNLHDYIGPERDLRIHLFHKHLEQFIAIHAAEIDDNYLEE